MFDSTDAPVNRLRWEFTDLPFLPPDIPTVITNRIWDADHVSELVTGQLPLDSCRYVQDDRFKFPPIALTGHQCNPQWFASGEPWPAALDLPPTVYLAGWVPECCAMQCEFEDCAANPVNGAPASQRYQYALPATEATSSTPTTLQSVMDAADVGGGNWPGALTAWLPEGRDSTPAYSQLALSRPDGTPYSVVRGLVFDPANTLTETLDAAGYAFQVVQGGVSATMLFRIFAGAGQLTGTNWRIAPAVLPAEVVYRSSAALVGSGTTQGGATYVGPGTHSLTAPDLANVAFVLGAVPGAEVDIIPGPTIAQTIYPPAGESFPGLAPNAPIIVLADTMINQAVRFTRADVTGTGGVWTVQNYNYHGSPGGGGGTVTSVDIATTSAGLIVGGGPIVGAGTLTVDLDPALDSLTALAGVATLIASDGLGLFTAVTIGPNLNYAGGVLSASSPTANGAQLTFLTTPLAAPSGIPEIIGVGLELPGAGTYLITARIRAELNPAAPGTSWITAELFNATTALAVVDSETLVVWETVAGVTNQATATVVRRVTVAANDLITIRAARFGLSWNVSQIVSDVNGRTTLEYTRLD